MKHITTYLALLMLSLFINQNLLASCTCTGNLVSNSSFESGTTGWSASGGHLNAGTGAVKCGSKSGDFQITNSTHNRVYQRLSANYVAGTTFQLSVYAGTHDNSYNHYVGFEYYDANWNYKGQDVVHVNKILSHSPTGPQLYTVNGTVPAGATRVQVVAKGSGSWIKTDGWCATVTSTSCTGDITGLKFNDLNGSSDVTIANNGTYDFSNLPASFNLEAIYTGFIESVKFTVSGSATATNIEEADPYNSPGSGSAFTHGPGTYTVVSKAYQGHSATGTLCDTKTTTFTLTGCPGFCAPTPSCTGSDKFGWSQTINSSTGAPSVVRLINSSKLTYTITNGIPAAAKSGPMTIQITDAVSYDGYTNRVNVIQTNERWRLKVYKGTTVVYTSPYTPDIADHVKQASWQGALGSAATISNGFDKVVIEHIGGSGPGSVVPTSFCIKYTPCGNITTPGSIATNYTYCNSGNPPSFTSVNNATGGCGGSVHYQWQKRVGTSGTWANISGATAATYNQGTTTTTTQFRRAAKRTTETTWKYTNVVTITINKQLTAAGTIAASQTFCNSGNPANITSTAAASGGNGGNITYQWYSYEVGVGPWTAISGATAATYNPPTITKSTHYRRGAKRSVCGNLIYTPYVTMTIYKQLTSAGAIGSPQTFCNSGNVANLTNTTTPSGGLGGTIQYVWQKSTNNSTWFTIGGATSSTYDPGTVITNTYYRRGAKRSVCGSYQYTSSVKVTVNKELTNAGAIGSPQTFCNSGNVANLTNTTFPSGGTGGIVQYVWQKSTNNSTWSTVSGATSSSYNPGIISTTTYYRRGAKRSVCGTYDYTSSVKVTVNKALTSAGTIGSNQTFCNSGDPVAFTNVTSPAGGSGGSIVYQWYSREYVNNAWTPYNPITGATSSTYNSPSISTTTQFRRYAKRSVCGNLITSNTVTVTVNKSLVSGGAVGSNQTFCGSGNPATFTNTTSASGGSGGTVVYQWQKRTGTSGSYANISGATSSTYNAPSVTATTQYRRRAARSTCAGNKYSNVVTVTVNPLPTSGISGLNTVCATESIALNATATSGLTFSWSATGGATATGSTTGPGVTYTWPVSAENTVQTVTLVVTNSDNCSKTYTKSVSVTTKVFAAAGPDKTICQGGSTQIGGSPAGPAGATYSWTPNFGLNSTTVANPQANPIVTTTYTLTTTLNGCVKSDQVEVTVNSLLGPNADAGGNKNLCQGSTVTIGGNPTSTATGVIYQWTPSAGLNNATIANPVASAAGQYKVKVTNNSGCFNEDSIVVTQIVCAVTVSGTLFNDVNALTDNDVNGTPIGMPSNTPIYATLVDPSGNVVATTQVGSNGTYSFPNVPANTTYTVVLSTVAGVVGNPAPTVDLPTGWMTTGESPNNSTSDGTPNSIQTVVVGTDNVPNIDFGIQQPPTPGTNVQPSQVNPGGNVSVGVPSNGFSGNDPSGGTVTSLRIVSFPTNTESITINGTTYTQANWPAAGVTIPTNAAGEPTQTITLNPVDGAVTATILYKSIDDAGVESPSTGSVKLPFGVITLSGNVFEDNNGPATVDGTGVGSPSSTPIYANLVGPDGKVVDRVAVGPTGAYTFNEVTPNTTYTVVLSTTQGTVGNNPPSPSLPFGWENVSEDCCDNTGNDGNTNGITTAVVGTNNVPDVNFGITQPLSIGNTVFVDDNQDGNYDSGEAFIGGATVKIYEDNNSDGTPDGAAIATTTTNPNGVYRFDDLTPGNYVVGVTPPTPASGPAFESTDGPGQSANPNDNVNNDDNGINTIGGETFSGTVTVAAGTEPTNDDTFAGIPDENSNLSIDFGFYQPISITGNVFEDNNGETNVDGTPISNPSNTPVYANLVDAAGNVVGTDLINSNGTYEFTDVEPNTTYTVVLSTTQGTVGNPAPTADLPTGWDNVGEDCCDNTGNDGTPNGAVTVTVGTTDVDEANFGITQPLSVGNRVFNDENQDGNYDSGEAFIGGATVKIYEDNNSDGTPDGAAIGTTTTNASGIYSFDDLKPGSYVIGVTPPTPTNGPAFESTDGPAQSSNPNDDVNDDDNGINTVNGETLSGTVTLAAGTEPTNDDTYNAVPDANSNMSVDFGFFQPIKIAGNVYQDENGETNVDGTPINNPSNTPVFANLVDAAGNVVATDPINTNGTYEFTDVEPNTTYTVVLSTTQGTVGNPAPAADLPTGWDNVGEDCCDNTGNDGTPNGVVTVTTATTDVDEANFGINQPLAIGNTVWIDENQDGTLQTTEPKLQGATVSLYEDANSDGTPDGAAIDTKTTDANGDYLFTGLDAGNYVVGVTPPTPATGPAYESTDGPGQEMNPNDDGDNNDNGINTVGGETFSGTVTIAAGTEPTNDNTYSAIPDANSNLSVDFGFAQPIKLSGIVFNDESGPANVDGSPIGQAGTTQLYANLIKPDGTVERTIPIDNQGMYSFDDVAVNTSYQVVLTDSPGTVGNNAPAASLPNGWLTVSEDGDGDGIGNDGMPDGINLATTGTQDLPMVNFGIREPVSVGNVVWIDENQNGIKDANELPLQNAIVNIYEDDNNDGNPDGAAIATTTTGSDGLYEFSDLNSGKFIVGVVPPTIQNGSYVSPTVGEEANPNLDVDNNDNGVNQVGMEVRSGTINLIAGAEPTGELPNNTDPVPDANSNLTVDFGFYACPTGFNFDPVDVCSGTFDLTTAEPAEFTGGVWTENNQVVTTPTAVGTGTYTYNFNNGTCSATGSLLISDNIPDYTPTIQIAPSAITGTSNVRVILTISEILDKDACSDLFILVPKLLPRFVFQFLPNASTVGGVAVDNADWQYFENANPNFYIWKYTSTGGLFPGNGSSKIGYIGSYDPNNTDGQSTFSVQVFQGSGGETNQTNNTDSDLLIYFR